MVPRDVCKVSSQRSVLGFEGKVSQDEYLSEGHKYQNSTVLFSDMYNVSLQRSVLALEGIVSQDDYLSEGHKYQNSTVLIV
jgi:hypothetical protein